MIASRLRHRPRGTAIFLSRYLRIRITLGLKSEAITRDVESEREEEKSIGSKLQNPGKLRNKDKMRGLQTSFLYIFYTSSQVLTTLSKAATTKREKGVNRAPSCWVAVEAFRHRSPTRVQGPVLHGVGLAIFSLC